MPTEYKGNKLALKYLFTAFFEDGHEIKQNDDDISVADPKRSTFFDVLEYEKTSRLIKFVIKTHDAAVSVDLTTGLFQFHNPLASEPEFSIADQNFEPTEPLRIVYFRETRVETDVNPETQEIMGERFYINKFYIGWQTNWKGANYQRTIAVGGE